VGAGGDDDFIFGQFCKALWEFIERNLKTKTHFTGLGYLRKTNIHQHSLFFGRRVHAP
jgi:hypothetical protein